MMWLIMGEKKQACFLGAIQAAAEKRGKKEVGERAVVHADVIFGESTDRPGYGLKWYCVSKG